MCDNILFSQIRIREHLWVKPRVILILLIIVAFLSYHVDQIQFLEVVLEVIVKFLDVLPTITLGNKPYPLFPTSGKSNLVTHGLLTMREKCRNFHLQLVNNL